MLWVLICYFSGWYMALKPDEGDQMSRAVVQSPTMKQASGTCTLHFYYNMYGEGNPNPYASACVQPLK